MDKLAVKAAEYGYGSIFLYTNEAHPGENYAHLTSFEQKLRHANLLRSEGGIQRPILVDALDGACHRQYGSMPNMTWIFSRVGVPVYKSDWTDVHSVESCIDYLVQIRDRRRSGERLAPFHVERADFRVQDREAFFAGLARNGPKAVREFEEAFD